MKRCIAVFICVFGSLGAVLDPIDIALTYPPMSAVVSNTITVTATAHSSVAPITKVEFYRDGVLFKTVYNPQPPAATNLAVTK